VSPGIDCHCLGFLRRVPYLTNIVWTLIMSLSIVVFWKARWSFTTRAAIEVSLFYSQILAGIIILSYGEVQPELVRISIVSFRRNGTTEICSMRIENLNDIEIAVKEVAASCDCVHFKNPPDRIAPGSSAEFEYCLEAREDRVRPILSFVLGIGSRTVIVNSNALPP